MREIKFRTYSKEDEEMYYSNEMHWNIDFHFNENGNLKCYINYSYADSFGDEHDQWVELDNIMQYTGLKDKNGKEIYEGDICKYTFDLPNSSYATENGLKIRISKVFWSDWRGSFAIGNSLANNDLFNYVRNGNRVEVIGNIYENPELLEVE
ncbi:YopX family protein [Tissierella pigra]|uniref:YopX family protein n=1 Tax=Tissierella pigra TaxID=2607614 RepID=UPI001C114814|nr:YopX family protein [Tissierella pigra]